jgi:D-alanyl-D-alanine carboxypeptidase
LTYTKPLVFCAGPRLNANAARRHRRARNVLAGLLCFGSFARPTQAAVADARLAPAVAAIEGALETSPIPGLVIGITDRNRTQGVIVHGYADLKNKIPLTADSPFAIGSISKSFTAVALMELRDEGRFDPQVPIVRYVPWLKVSSPFPPITGHHLLSHTSGLPLYRADLSSSRYAAYALRAFRPSYRPGAHFWYSDLGFQLLGYAIEEITGTPYHSFIERHVLRAIGMTSSFAVIDDSLRDRLPVSYTRWPYDETSVESSWFEYSAADGSIVATAGDMCAYARFILNRGKTDQGQLISAESFDLMTRPVIEDYAYGLASHQRDGESIIEHAGSIGGFHSYLEAHMNDGFAVVLLSNGPLERPTVDWIIDMLKAAHRGTPLPAPLTPVAAVRDVGPYAGVYRARDGKTLEFRALDGELRLERPEAPVRLLQMGADSFRAPPDDAAPYPFLFGRATQEADAPVVEVSSGAAWYTNDRYTDQVSHPPPDDYLTYVGHYENHNPEGPTARIFVRGNQLLALVDGEVPKEGVEVLKPLRRGLFRPSEPAYNPERYRFDTVIDGHALRLLVSGTPLYRVETP